MHSSLPSQPAAVVQWPLVHRQISGLHWSGGVGQRTLALHGWLDNAASFVPLAAHLPGVDLYAMDWVGHGHSEHRPAGCGGGFMNNLEDLLAVADQLGPAPLDLIGHSMGGALACLFAAAFPERVRRLVLIEALGPMSLKAERFTTELRRALEVRRDFKDRRRMYPDLQAPIAARMAAGNLSAASARLLIERGTETSADGVRFRSDPRETLPSLQRGGEEQVLAALAQINCPRLVILAEPATSYLSGALAEERLRALRIEHPHRLLGNHHLHMETPEVLAPLIRRFLSEADESSLIDLADTGNSLNN
jgi:pimeloyl-ACP methyl ester carboxylesterase